MLKTLVIMLMAVTAGTVGDLFLAKGMKELGDISTMNLRGILNIVLKGIFSFRIVLGTILLAVFFFLWLTVLSWEDLSVALPLQAINYIAVAFLSQYFLGEVVSPLRWIGILLICIGVMIVTKSSGLR